MNIQQFLFKHPVFRFEEFAEFKMTRGVSSPASVNTALNYYTKRGRIKPIRRKLYAVVPPNQTSDNILIDPYLIAGKATEDSVIGYHSALELLGVAYSSFGQFTYISQQKSKPFDFDGNWYQPIAVPITLRKKQTPDVYVETINRQGVDIKVTNAARTFVDVLDRVLLCGGWEEVYRSISNIAVLNVEQVIKYALILNNSRLIAKVGYFLSQRKDAFRVDEKQLKQLLACIPKVPQYVSGKAKEQLQFVNQWNIYLPLSVINQKWEEPDVEI